MSGLLAAAAEELDDTDLERFAQLAALPLGAIDTLLRSADTFLRPDAAIPVDEVGRRQLIDRFGMFGVRLCLGLLTSGTAGREDLSDELRVLGGIVPIREVVIERFAARNTVIRVGVTLKIAERLIAEIDNPAIRQHLDAELDRLRTQSFELRELDHLRMLRLSPDLRLTEDERAIIERSLGGFGPAAHQRVGARETDSPDQLRAMAFETKRQLSTMRGGRGPARNAVQAADRSLDRVLAQLERPSSP